MAVSATRVTLTTTAALISSQAGGTWQRESGVALFPQASGTIILGPAGVTDSTGVRVAVTAGAPLSIDLPYGDALYALVASGTLAVDVLQVGV